MKYELALAVNLGEYFQKDNLFMAEAIFVTNRINTKLKHSVKKILENYMNSRITLFRLV